MACARCGCGIRQTDDFITLNKVWHRSCFTCYKCNKNLDKKSAKIFQGELFCECCYACLIEEFEILSFSPRKPCSVVSSPSCTFEKRLENCENILKTLNSIKCRDESCKAVCDKKCFRKTVSCSCLPDRGSKTSNVRCYYIPIPREVANYYNRCHMKSRPSRKCPAQEDPCCCSEPPCIIIRPHCSKPPQSSPQCRPCRSPVRCPSPSRCCCPKCKVRSPPCSCSDCCQECRPPSPRCCQSPPKCCQSPPKCCPLPKCFSSPPKCCASPPRVCVLPKKCPSPPPCCRNCRQKSPCRKPPPPPSCYVCCEDSNTCNCYRCRTICICGNRKPCNCKMAQLRAVCSSCCVRCGEKVYAAEKIVVSSGAFHSSCFSCYCCNKCLDVKNVYEGCGEIYCKHCYNHFFGCEYYGFGNPECC